MTTQEQLRALIERHHANFLEQIAMVGQLLAARDPNAHLPRPRIIEAQSITHQLKGTAGSMGFAEVGAAAAALDERLKGLKSAPEPVSAVQLEPTLDCLAALEHIAEETRPEMSTLYDVDLSQLAR